jgi:hypothetical protein
MLDVNAVANAADRLSLNPPLTLIANALLIVELANRVAFTEVDREVALVIELFKVLVIDETRFTDATKSNTANEFLKTLTESVGVNAPLRLILEDLILNAVADTEATVVRLAMLPNI